MTPTREWLSRLGLVVIPVGVLLAVMEVALRVAGFSYVLHPTDVEFGRPDPVMMKAAFLPDDDLFWVTRQYPERLAELARRRPELLFLGDSCTQFGRYDEEVARLYRERTGRELAWGNLGVAGWTTHQGLAQLRRDGVPLAPRWVTLYYGWNDHWIGFGIEDAEVARVRHLFTTRWSGFRLVQLATRATVAWKAARRPFPNRVPLADFRANLAAMAATARDHGIVPVFLTAPSGHVAGEEPPELAERWLRDLDELVPLHRAYGEAVREVGREQRVRVCDLEADFAAMPVDVRRALFMDDGIHLREDGNRLLGARLFACLEPEILPPIEGNEG